MESKTLRPRASAKQDIDVIILVDGSESVIGTDFNREKQLCMELAARLAGNSQLGVIQFGGKAQIITPLTTNREELEKKVDGMTKISGSANLGVAFEICYSEFSRSRATNNQRQVWIFTNGNFKQDPRNSTLTEKLIREKQVTVIAIGIGHRVDLRLLNRLAAPGCCFLVGDFPKALKLFQYNPNKERNCQISANIIFPNSVPFRFGEPIILRFEVENVGLKDIPQKTKFIIRENAYFKGETVVFYETLSIGQQISFYVRLIAKDIDSLDSYLSLLPEMIEFNMCDAADNEITCDCTGFFFNLEDFSGNVSSFKPPQDLELINVMIFGQPGAGKSFFVNSICSALSDHIHNLAIVASPKKVGGKSMQKFQLNLVPGFEQIPIALYDLPGVEEDNFQGDELDKYLDGLVDNKQTVVYETVKGRKVTPHEALAQRMHVVAFFVRPVIEDYALEVRLQQHLAKITEAKNCRVVVIIGHSDTVLEADARIELHNSISKKFSTDPSNVFFLENYVDVKDKQFSIDRNVLRIVLALVGQATELIVAQRPGAEEGESSEHPIKPTIIDPESLPRDEKEALMLENNEMHVHISKLQAQNNYLTNYKAALESLLTEDQKLALRGEPSSPKSVVQQIVYSPLSFVRSLVFGSSPSPSVQLPNPPSPPVTPRAIRGSKRLSSNYLKPAPSSPSSPTASPPSASPLSGSPPSPSTRVRSTSSSPNLMATSPSSSPSPPAPSGPKYGAPRAPSAPKGDGSMFSLVNRNSPKASPRALKVNVRTKDVVRPKVGEESPSSPAPPSSPSSPSDSPSTTTTPSAPSPPSSPSSGTGDSTTDGTEITQKIGEASTQAQPTVAVVEPVQSAQEPAQTIQEPAQTQ